LTTNSNDEVLNAVWSLFETKNVVPINADKALTYYEDHATEVKTVEGLLKEKDGQCSSWVKLLVATLRVHGIDYQKELVRVTPPGGGDIDSSLGFAVKEWSFGENASSGDSSFPYLNIVHLEDASYPYVWRYEEVSDGPGAAGQGGVEDPKSLFRLHYVFTTDGFWYFDPSYGIKYHPMALDNAFAALTKVVEKGTFDESSLNAGAGWDINGNGETYNLVSDDMFLGYLFRKKKENVVELIPYREEL
jgi:hypothetical protein